MKQIYKNCIIFIGWGNTGHSKVVIAVQDCQHNIRHYQHISRLTHERQHFVLSIDENTGQNFLEDIEEGDEIGVWSVSAPYPGKCEKLSVTSML